MSKDNQKLCACGCGRKFTPTRTWGVYYSSKCRWEAWILKKAEKIKKLRRAAKAVAAIAILFFIGGCSDAYATVNMEAIKQIESGGNPKAHNKRTNARGLYQITPICLAHYHALGGNRWIGEKELFNPEINTKVATWYFSWLERQGLDDIEQVAAFNWGIGNVKKWLAGKKELPCETQDYLTKYQALTSDGGK